MVKNKITYKCTNCSYQVPKWIGCCPECNEWNAFTEVKPATSLPGKMKRSTQTLQLTQLQSIKTNTYIRMKSGIAEWDHVVGGGLMPGSLNVLTGDPGIGKSTLLLQVANKLASHYQVFYFSTEESLQQIKQRADRLGTINNQLLFSDNAELGSILTTAEQAKPNIIIIDSIQNCFIQGTQTLPGSIGQLREAAFQLMRMSKEHEITVIITGHITKEGIIAGPKTLEHIVDAVFYLQSEDRWQTRMLRAVKNRFGAINELGFFEMKHNGLQEVPNINQNLISEASYAPGSTLISAMEGSRPLLLELQALTIASKLTMPQRVISGLDHKQVVLVAAILEKYVKIKLSAHDIFFKVSGGFKIKGSVTDLGIALALLSSYFQQPLPEKSIALGEISLTGQIKPINQINTFAREAEKFGIYQLLIAKNQKIEKTKCRVTRFHNVYELLSLFND